jgi:hypothetical protein
VVRRSRAAIAVPARPPGEPPRRQPRHPRQARSFPPPPTVTGTNPRCDDRLSSGEHRRVIRPPTHPITAIRPIELAQIHARDSVEYKPREMPLRQRIPNVGRQQERLITITPNEVLSHPGIVLNPPDDTVITRHPLAEAIVGLGDLRTMKAVVSAGTAARVLDAYCSSATSPPRVAALTANRSCALSAAAASFTEATQH